LLDDGAVAPPSFSILKGLELKRTVRERTALMPASRGNGQTISSPTAVRLALVTIGIGWLAMSTPALEAVQKSFSRGDLDARLPVVQEHSYVVNARIRPLLLFWIGRDNIGEARLTRREASGGRRAIEFLIGSDPDRAPRRINRWGFIIEELGPEEGAILGVMSESNEETIDEAKAGIERQDGYSVFKVARATVAANRAAGGTMTVRAPAHLTYRELEAVLALIPAAPEHVRSVELPSGTQKGFLVAMESMLRASVEPCRTADGGRPKDVRSIPYLYNQTIFDLSLTSCKHEPELQTKGETVADVIDGRFRLRNRTTKYDADFRMLYGASGDLREIPVRATFRPRWWLEVELLLDRTAKAGRRTFDDD
jgi:hypothetical protein